jgi:D-alanyl-D-alanine carboxypeptidase
MNHIGRKPPGFTITLFLFLILPWLVSCSVTHRPSLTPSLEQAFANALERFRLQHEFPGITASYLLPSGKNYSAAAGWADLERREAMTVESRMLAASIGKTFVAATMVSLAREQAIDLDAPVSDWLGHKSWFEQIPNHKSMTLRHLLNHTSGLPNHVYVPAFNEAASTQWPAPGNSFTPEVLVSFIFDAEPLFPPGESWAYTDTGYVLIGLVIEAITGRTYYEELNDRFLGPLRLKATTPSNQRSLSNLAAGYVAADNAFGFPLKTTDQNGVLVWHPGLEWTGGGLISTSRDLAHWGDALFRSRALPDEDLHAMLESVPIGADTLGIHYGLGIAINQSGLISPVYGHGGWIPGYSSSLRHYPGSGITIAFQVNSDRISHNDLSEIELCLAHIVISDGQNTDCVP